uniref:Uncharacterized protein n=1 Tax=Arundo donax TaxID=35708 RepID=A0A0A9CBT4_ARUDO
MLLCTFIEQVVLNHTWMHDRN